jgi:tripartite-type tricarboxylate transporter receptor subunit TctC
VLSRHPWAVFLCAAKRININEEVPVFHILGISLFVTLASLIGLSTPSAAAGYPNKPVRIIIPFAPGGGTDVITRLLQPRIEKALSTNVLIDNRTGAGGTIGVGIAARAKPDGYTLMTTSASFSFADAIFKDKIPYNSKKDFQPITMLVNQPLILAVHPSMPVKNVKELIALALKKPGEIFHANAGYGSNLHMSTELFKYMAGQQHNKDKFLPITAVQYKGGGPSLIALISGEVQVSFTGMLSSKHFREAGQMRAIAVSTKQRSAALPNVPTIDESGVSGFDKGAWTGMFIQAAVPKPIVNHVYQSVAKVLKDPEAVKLLADDGVTADGRTPEEFTKFVHAEIDEWAKAAKKMGL